MTEESTQTPKLYTSTAVVIATMIGTLAAGIYMVFANYRALGYPKLASKVAIAGICLFAVLTAFTALLPQESLEYSVLFTLLQAGIAYAAAETLQSKAVVYHIARGGSLHSNWTAISIGLLAVVALLAMMFVVVAVLTGMGVLTPPAA